MGCCGVEENEKEDLLCKEISRITELSTMSTGKTQPSTGARNRKNIYKSTDITDDEYGLETAESRKNRRIIFPKKQSDASDSTIGISKRNCIVKFRKQSYNNGSNASQNSGDKSKEVEVYSTSKFVVQQSASSHLTPSKYRRGSMIEEEGLEVQILDEITQKKTNKLKYSCNKWIQDLNLSRGDCIEDLRSFDSTPPKSLGKLKRKISVKRSDITNSNKGIEDTVENLRISFEKEENKSIRQHFNKEAKKEGNRRDVTNNNFIGKLTPTKKKIKVKKRASGRKNSDSNQENVSIKDYFSSRSLIIEDFCDDESEKEPGCLSLERKDQKVSTRAISKCIDGNLPKPRRVKKRKGRKVIKKFEPRSSFNESIEGNSEKASPLLVKMESLKDTHSSINHISKRPVQNFLKKTILDISKPSDNPESSKKMPPELSYNSSPSIKQASRELAESSSDDRVSCSPQRTQSNKQIRASGVLLAENAGLEVDSQLASKEPRNLIKIPQQDLATNNSNTSSICNKKKRRKKIQKIKSDDISEIQENKIPKEDPPIIEGNDQTPRAQNQAKPEDTQRDTKYDDNRLTKPNANRKKRKKMKKKVFDFHKKDSVQTPNTNKEEIELKHPQSLPAESPSKPDIDKVSDQLSDQNSSQTDMSIPDNIGFYPQKPEADKSLSI